MNSKTGTIHDMIALKQEQYNAAYREFCYLDNRCIDRNLTPDERSRRADLEDRMEHLSCEIRILKKRLAN